MGREFHEHQEQDCPGTGLKKQQMKQSYSTYHTVENMETELLMSLHYPQCNTHMCVHDSYTQKTHTYSCVNTHAQMWAHPKFIPSQGHYHLDYEFLLEVLLIFISQSLFYMNPTEAFHFFSVFLLCSTSLNNFKGPRHQFDFLASIF